MVFGVSVAYRNSCTSYAVGGGTVDVIDGETIKVLTTIKQQIPFRIAFIDALQKGQAFGQRSKAVMSELVSAKMSNSGRARLIVTGA